MDETLTSPRRRAGTARAALPNFPFLVARAQKEENANSPPYIPTLHPTSLVSCTQTVADFITGVSPLRGAWRGGFGTRPAADSCPAAAGSPRAEARQRLRWPPPVASLCPGNWPSLPRHPAARCRGGGRGAVRTPPVRQHPPSRCRTPASPGAHLRPKSLRPVKRLLLCRRPSGGGPRSGSAPPEAPAVEEAAAEEDDEPPSRGDPAASMAELGARRHRYRHPAPGEGTGEGGGRCGRPELPPHRGQQEVRPRTGGPGGRFEAAAPPVAARGAAERGSGRPAAAVGSAQWRGARRCRLRKPCQPRRRPALGKRLGGRSGASSASSSSSTSYCFIAGRGKRSQQPRRCHRPLRGPGATAGLAAGTGTAAPCLCLTPAVLAVCPASPKGTPSRGLGGRGWPAMLGSQR